MILAWRLVEELERCVRAVRSQEGDFLLEVVVVVNGAPEAVQEAARRSAPDRLLVSETNLGYGGGCTLGIDAVDTDYVVLLNDDAVPEAGWLQALVGAAEADETIAAVSSLLLNDDGTIQEAGCRVVAHGATHPIAGGLTVEAAREAGLLVTHDVDYGSGAALLLRRSAVAAVGGFDKRYEPAYYEDVDLQFRLHLAGHRVVVEPSAVAVHSSGLSTAGSSTYYRDFLSSRALELFQERWAEVLERLPEASADAPGLAPVAEFGVAERPASRNDEPSVVFTGLEAEFERWAFERLAFADDRQRHTQDTLDLAARRQALAEVTQAELLRLRDELAHLRAQHRELGETANALRRRVDQFESNPVRRAARKALGRSN
ncbi:hypothetical protein GCM10025867_37500 [Frondihabitans sucicola]|uniref:Glycosyltransferase 2-like domain-containing protein n=1 Tax=Frondihabitans sucicola TaxID=1268041 RepID=A0ABM8GSQ6_9MICO|nr:hypothetical protein GCM10025867_37500 [Frondihabitans sucicola]